MLSLLVGISTSLIAVLGLVAVQEEGAIPLIPFVLIPPVVLATVVRRPRTALTASIITLVLSSLPWTLVALGDDDWLGLAIVGYPVVFLTCLAAAGLDDRHHRLTVSSR